MHHVERVEQGRGHGHATEKSRPALLEAFEHQHAGGEIHPIRGQCEGFGQTTAGIGQGHAQGSHRAIRPLGLL